jgi:hypothetical protein
MTCALDPPFWKNPHKVLSLSLSLFLSLSLSRWSRALVTLSFEETSSTLVAPVRRVKPPSRVTVCHQRECLRQRAQVSEMQSQTLKNNLL